MAKFDYDALGRVVTAVKEISSTVVSETEFVYNDMGYVTDTNETLFGGTTRTIQYVRNQAGQVVRQYYPYVINVDTRRDWQGRIVDDGHSYYKYIGQRVARRYMNNIYYVPSYDNLGRITHAHTYFNGGSDIADFNYEYKPMTNDISQQQYAHRNNDPCTDFSYDNLDRLTRADYDIESQYENFTIDDLGNRDMVHLRSGTDVNYVIDNTTNRYSSVGGTNLTYDAAGNLTKDKNGYTYYYDYENRIVKIKKSNDTIDVAKYDYDALGRRIRKTDCVTAGNSRLYYYNDNWQVLEERDSSDSALRGYLYGNYIDEVLTFIDYNDTWRNYIYVHDHLYSPVALVKGIDNGLIVERYEYDAYGSVTIHTDDGNDETWLTADDDLSSHSAQGNSYFFTGRTLDILNNGTLKIQYNRNRYYDPQTGRWLTQDPLGITPAGNLNPFSIQGQYLNGMNLYEYVISNPIANLDTYGFYKSDCDGGIHELYLYIPIDDPPYFRKILFGWYSMKQNSACRCQDCCDIADGKYREKVGGGWRYLIGRKRRSEICYTGCENHQYAWYYY